MPPVNNLTGNTAAPPKPATPAPKPTPPKPATPAVPPTPPKPHSLANLDNVKTQSAADEQKKTADLAKRLQTNLPAWLQQNNNMPLVVPQDSSGFVGFAHPMSKKWPLQQQAGLETGDIYLFRDNQYIPKKEGLKFFLLCGASYQSLMNQKGEFLWATTDLEENGPTQGNNTTEPHYICLLLVEDGDYLVPIKGDFRGTKSRGIEGAIRAVEAAASPEWLGLSDKHRITAAFPTPFGRVFHHMTTQRYIGKSTGNESFITNVTSMPSTIAQMQMLADEFDTQEFQDELAEARQNYDARIAFMNKVCENPKI